MKIDFDTIKTTKLSDKVTRKRVIGDKLEIIFYTYQAGAIFTRHQHEAEQLTIVLKGELPQKLKDEASLYAGCVASAIQKDDYLGIISDTGFNNVKVEKQKLIDLPDSLLLKYLTEKELDQFKALEIGIFSITNEAHLIFRYT